MASRTDSEIARDEFLAVARLYRAGRTLEEACREVYEDAMVAEIIASFLRRHAGFR